MVLQTTERTAIRHRRVFTESQQVATSKWWNRIRRLTAKCKKKAPFRTLWTTTLILCLNSFQMRYRTNWLTWPWQKERHGRLGGSRNSLVLPSFWIESMERRKLMRRSTLKNMWSRSIQNSWTCSLTAITVVPKNRLLIKLNRLSLLSTTPQRSKPRMKSRLDTDSRIHLIKFYWPKASITKFLLVFAHSLRQITLSATLWKLFTISLILRVLVLAPRKWRSSSCMLSTKNCWIRWPPKKMKMAARWRTKTGTWKSLLHVWYRMKTIPCFQYHALQIIETLLKTITVEEMHQD